METPSADWHRQVLRRDEVLKGVDLTVAEGSFTSLLGPSGCGKTTLLSIIGGLERPSLGEIRMGPDLVCRPRGASTCATEKRNFGYVFQNYALWPHMTVLQNVAYALQIRRLTRRSATAGRARCSTGWS